MKNIMTYKGYWAEINYSEEDGINAETSRILKQTKNITVKKPSKELKKDFKEAIDHYLSVCKERNEKPDKQCKGSLNVRLGTDLHCKAKMKSIEQNISINELIKQAVVSYLKTN